MSALEANLVEPDEVAAALRASGAVRAFLDRFASSRPDPRILLGLAEELERWADKLGPTVDENRRIIGRISESPCHGQAFIPPVHVVSSDDNHRVVNTRFGAHHLGRRGAAHGGAIMALLDDVFGHFIPGDHSMRHRTVHFEIDFQALTPVDELIEIECRLQGREGRKLDVGAEVRHGSTVCATARARFVTLKPGQR